MTLPKGKRALPTTAALPLSASEALKVGAFDFPIVGIGASAGGLDAFEQFLAHVPIDSGSGFVLVQHLDPSHASLLAEILARATRLPVSEVTDGMRVQPDHVHVIPPNCDITIRAGVLYINPPALPRGQRLPIDSFFCSLAEDQRENAVGIVLSGTGSDGTLGCRAILDHGGRTLVQDPDDAAYAGMPESVIKAGNAGGVHAACALPQALLNAAHFVAKASSEHGLPSDSAVSPALTFEAVLPAIVQRLRLLTGHDFSLYKKSTIIRRIERRMMQHQLDELGAYQRYLENNAAEVHALFKDLLINVTQFFRDPDAFALLKSEVLPQLLANKTRDYVLRVWIAGCASGEEAYSVAIVLREIMDEAQREFQVQLYATDLDDDAISIARAGIYPETISKAMSAERLKRFFIAEDGRYRVRKEIRDMVVFAVHDVAKDPPFTRLDLLCCRNLMIYLESALQARLMPAFHYALKPGGVLFLSPSESIGSHADLFACLHRKWKLYSALHTATEKKSALIGSLSWAAQHKDPSLMEPMKKLKELNIADLTRRMLLQDYVPASVVTDMASNIVYIHGDTGDYLRPAPGQATLNVVDMAREGLQLELRTALHQFSGSVAPIPEHSAVIKSRNGLRQVNFEIRPLTGTGLNEPLLLISFKDSAEEPAAQVKRGRGKASVASTERVQSLERELSYLRANHQSAIEELQSANEELKSTNEEMQSANEELQSSNEELETSREELQSVNEELVTVNTELQEKIEQLGEMKNDMKNLLDNINVGTLFLDSHLMIRRFTREATQVYRLIAGDVGRPLADITSHLDNSTDLLARAQEVLDTLIPYEAELHTSTGAWFLARIQPYRTLDNVIDGVVLTFHDVTKRVAIDHTAKVARELAEAIVATVTEPLLVLDQQLRVVLASRSYLRDFNVRNEDTLGHSFYELGTGQWDVPALRDLMQKLLASDTAFDGYELKAEFPGMGKHTLLLNARRVVGNDVRTPLILLALQLQPEESGAR